MRRVTSLGTTIGLGSLFLINITKHQDENESENIKKIRRYEKIILGVATGQYIVSYRSNYDILQNWRYLDWAITTPLLLKTFHLLAVEKGYDKSAKNAIIYDLIMIASGYLAENKLDNLTLFNRKSSTKKCNSINKIAWYSIGVAAYIGVLIEITKWYKFLKEKNVNVDNLLYFFYIGWTLYALNFLNPEKELKQMSFDVLDFFNKGVYSIVLNSVIEKEF